MTRHEHQPTSRFRWNAAKWVAAAVVVVAIIYFAVGRGQGKPDASDSAAPAPVAVDVATAVIRPMDTIVSAQGTLVPCQGASAKIAAVSAGRLISVRVKEGEQVTAGQVVAILDNLVPNAQSASAVSALRVARIQAEQAKLQVEAAASDHTNAMRVAQLELQSAETELRKLRRGARPQEMAQADLAVSQAQATYSRTETELERVEFLFRKGIVAKRQLEDTTTALAVAKSAVETAKQQADLVRAGAREEDLKSAELRVETAKANLEQAKRGSLEVAAKKREALAAVESVSQKAADLAAARTTAGYAMLRAPIDGVVVHRLLNPGDMADPASPVLEIASLDKLDLSASVPADEGSVLRPGMQVRVSTTSSSGKTAAGRVLDVGQVDPQSGLLSVRVTVPNPGNLKAGAFATADIIVRTTPHAVVVPRQSVITRGGSQVAFIVGTDGTAHERAVTTGVESPGVIQVRRGIAPGERVIRMGQYELPDGAKVRVARQ